MQIIFKGKIDMLGLVPENINNFEANNYQKFEFYQVLDFILETYSQNFFKVPTFPITKKNWDKDLFIGTKN